MADGEIAFAKGVNANEHTQPMPKRLGDVPKALGRLTPSAPKEVTLPKTGFVKVNDSFASHHELNQLECRLLSLIEAAC